MSGGRLAHIFPGQGSQRVGMGAALFDAFPDEVAVADQVLGTSLRRLCLEDPERQLGRTDWTQPALFAVGALTHLAEMRSQKRPPQFLAGHSLGEYCALFAAGVFDFRTGLELTRRRGLLMAQAGDGQGGMAAVIGLSAAEVEAVLAREPAAQSLDLANINGPTQTVIAGPKAALEAISPVLLAAGAARVVPLPVSAAFHSRQMADAGRSFTAFLAGFRFADPTIPVIANTTARPYEPGRVVETLAAQITGRVRWTESVDYLLNAGVTEFRECGPGRVLTGLVEEIRKAPRGPFVPPAPEMPAPVVGTVPAAAPPLVASPPVSSAPLMLGAEHLGSTAFRADWGVRHAYVAGAMYKGIASPAMVIRLARAGLLGFLGAGGMRPAEIETAIATIRAAVPAGAAWGVNLISQPDLPRQEEDTVDLLLRMQVGAAEASAYLGVTPALVRYRLTGARRGPDGAPLPGNKVMAKLSRPEVAEAFLAPAPDAMLRALVEQGALSPEEAAIGRLIPMAGDITVEADSGGHTDGGSLLALLPTILALRDQAVVRHAYANAPRVGAAGGIGTPHGALAAFMLGADYVLTGSINQCSVEAGTSDAVKDLLEGIGPQDTTTAPAGDMFEVGARVQVVRRGLFFAARANKLHETWRHYPALESLPPDLVAQIEERFFRRPIAAVWQETRAYWAVARPELLARAETDPKVRMALVFRWYFAHSMRLALAGDTDGRVDWQIHCGPALGAFNRWAAGTPLAGWRQRHVDHMADALMEGTAALLSRRLRDLSPATRALAPV
ncbi:ACP S-malonyltransferase [Xanthobacteraceae bacterium A53D]